jgi:hypothetical protein
MVFDQIIVNVPEGMASGTYSAGYAKGTSPPQTGIEYSVRFKDRWWHPSDIPPAMPTVKAMTSLVGDAQQEGFANSIGIDMQTLEDLSAAAPNGGAYGFYNQEIVQYDPDAGNSNVVYLYMTAAAKATGVDGTAIAETWVWLAIV